jgi:acyl-CoA reductase-like NAD-dependent aldehyde dehydrogenase
MPLVTINPATGETVRAFAELTRGEIDAKLDAARGAFRVHRRSSFA